MDSLTVSVTLPASLSLAGGWLAVWKVCAHLPLLCSHALRRQPLPGPLRGWPRYAEIEYHCGTRSRVLIFGGGGGGGGGVPAVQGVATRLLMHIVCLVSQDGSWVCFSGVQTLSTSSLSVLSQMMHTISAALQSRLPSC